MPVLIAVLFLLLSGVGACAEKKADWQSKRVTHVHIGGRDFAVPNEYFRGPIPHEPESKRLYVWMMLPDYAPYRGELAVGTNLEEAWPRHLSVLIDDTAVATDLAFRYNATRYGPNNIFKPEDVSDAHGLHHTLVWYSNARSPTPFIESDLYYSQSDKGTVVTFAACDRDDPHVHPHPMCEEFFQDGRLLYKIGYRKTNLHNWHEINDHVHRLIDAFSCVPTNAAVNTAKNNNKGNKVCPV